MAATNGAAAATGLPEDPIILRARLAEVEARYAESQVQFRELRTWYDKLKRQHRELLWSEAVLAREGLEEALPGPPVADADRADGHIGGGFVLRHHLGAGAFAAVYAAVDREGRPCAVKRIDKYRIKSLEALRNVAGELRALRAAVGCPNLIWLNGVVASPSHLSLVMELFGTSNLQEAGAARPQDVRRAAPRIVRGVANGLAHLHARDLHHRDIKPENVLFDGADVKLCDFGLTTPCRRDASGARLRFPRAPRGNQPVASMPWARPKYDFHTGSASRGAWASSRRRCSTPRATTARRPTSGARACWPSRSSSARPTSTPCGSWPTIRSTSGAP